MNQFYKPIIVSMLAANVNKFLPTLYTQAPLCAFFIPIVHLVCIPNVAPHQTIVHA